MSNNTSSVASSFRNIISAGGHLRTGNHNSYFIRKQFWYEEYSIIGAAKVGEGQILARL